MQLHELQTVTANSLCSSLQVESLDIRYVSGMKEANSLFRSLSLSLAGATWGRDLISSFKSITNCSASCWCCATWGLVPSMLDALPREHVCLDGWAGRAGGGDMLVWNGCKSHACCKQEQG